MNYYLFYFHLYAMVYYFTETCEKSPPSGRKVGPLRYSSAPKGEGGGV